MSNIVQVQCQFEEATESCVTEIERKAGEEDEEWRGGEGGERATAQGGTDGGGGRTKVRRIQSA
eukprot:2307303-Pleurochrysis_carterae.AAC.1